MKKVLFNAALLLAGLLYITNAIAQQEEKEKKTYQEPKFKKTKSYSKSYVLSSSDKVSLYNQFGEMKIVTWEKNEVKVDVTITGKSDDEARSQEILERISITDSKNGGTVSFKTKFADDKKDDKKTWSKGEHRNEGMQIDYLVYLPSGNALNAENQFGKMIVPDFSGEATLESKFGSLTAGKISNAKSIIVEFGKADIAHINGGKLTIKFSEGTVSKLSGDIKASIEFSQAKLIIDNDVKSFDLHNSYATVYLDLNKSLSATYDIHTSHGSFSNKSDFTIKSQSEDRNGYGPRFDYRYTGTSGSGTIKIKATSSFGEIVAGHNLQVDLTKKKKAKATRTI